MPEAPSKVIEALENTVRKRLAEDLKTRKITQGSDAFGFAFTASFGFIDPDQTLGISISKLMFNGLESVTLDTGVSAAVEVWVGFDGPGPIDGSLSATAEAKLRATAEILIHFETDDVFFDPQIVSVEVNILNLDFESIPSAVNQALTSALDSILEGVKGDLAKLVNEFVKTEKEKGNIPTLSELISR